MNLKKFVLVLLGAVFALAGCGTMPSTEGESTRSIPGGMPGSMPGSVPSSMPGSSSGEGADERASREDGAEDSTSGEATTAEERSGSLDKSLDKSLGEFDKTLEEEQRRTAEERDARAANRTVTASTSGPEGGIGRREGDLRSERTGQSGSSGTDPAGGDNRDRGAVAGGSGAPDRSIPSGEDDDIVARRLRRAAEQETDPELKEKLWKEYMEYKRNVQGRG